jgi:hypothetical protein
MRYARTGMLAGALLGAGILVALLVGAWLRRSSVPGDSEEWLITFAYLTATPLSLLADAVQLRVESTFLGYAVILCAVPLNWAAIGWVLGALASLLRPRR